MATVNFPFWTNLKDAEIALIAASSFSARIRFEVSGLKLNFSAASAEPIPRVATAMAPAKRRIALFMNVIALLHFFFRLWVLACDPDARRGRNIFFLRKAQSTLARNSLVRECSAQVKIF